MIEEVNKAYSRLAAMRAARQRFKRFAFGRQWGDIMTAPDGSAISEGEYASLNGRQPLTNNMIHRLLATIVGHFRSREDPLATPADSRNRLDELDARMLEEFLISGCAVQRVVNERRPAGTGVWVDNVNPDDFFCSDVRDPRAIDVELIGMFHSWSQAETIARFAAGSKARAAEVRRLYADAERCRVIEVWTLEAAPRFKICDPIDGSVSYLPAEREAEITALNRKRAKKGLRRVEARLEYSKEWVGRFLTPDGIELGNRRTDRHPFALKFYPLLPGGIHPFVESLISQQKDVNRLITLNDNMMATSAKGVLLFPEDQLCDQLDWQDVRPL